MHCSSVGTFGIDSNVFASNYKAPTNHDHIGVAMVNTDSKKANSKKAESKEAEKKAVHLTLLSGPLRLVLLAAAVRD